MSEWKKSKSKESICFFLTELELQAAVYHNTTQDSSSHRHSKA